ncbi:MAG TPA: hypothetical protein VHB54_05305 [Mucilaginibacter sp.]|nr:hypothetical protein [Mucilaginibacter sp.]
MKTDFIKEIKIDESGRLCILPEKEKFTQIYRLGKEVHWDQNGRFLYSPKPQEWTYLDWYKHIVNIIKNECNIDLLITPNTHWNNITSSLQEQIIAL